MYSGDYTHTHTHTHKLTYSGTIRQAVDVVLQVAFIYI
jgi:hypothetical protein